MRENSGLGSPVRPPAAQVKSTSLRCFPGVLCLMLIGCSDSTDPETPGSTTTEVLAPLSHLEQVSPENDPLAEHRPRVVDCNTLTGWFIESIDAQSSVLEVNTGDCNYLALSEPAVAVAEPGDTLLTELSYFDLTAPEPTEAHVALLIRNEIVWQASIPIPSNADVLELEMPLNTSIAQGDNVGFHLHNHGQNSWNFSPIMVRHQAVH